MLNENFYRKLYSYIFYLPSLKILVLGIFSFLLLQTFLIIFFHKNFHWLFFEFYYFLLLYILKKTNILDVCNTKRLLGSYALISFYFLFVIFFDAKYSALFLVLILYFIIETLCYKYNYFKIILLSFIFSSPLIIYVFSTSNIFIATIVILIQLFYFLTFYMLFEKLKKYYNFNPYIFAKLFFYWKLTNNSRPLEIFLEKYSTKKDVQIDILILYDKNYNKCGILIFPHFHFGPAGDIGSSNFTYYIKNKLNNYFPSVVFHCEGSHEKDIVSSRYVEKVVNKIIESISLHKEKPLYIKLKGPVEEKIADIRCIALEISGKTIYFVERTAHSCEDIDENVYKKLGLKDNEILVELHNFHNPYLSCVWDEYYIKCLKRSIEACRRKLSQEDYEFGKINLYRIDKSNSRILKDDILDLGLSIIEMISNKKKICILIVDSNNIEYNSKIKLEQFLSKYYDFVIIGSTDSHSNSGVLNGILYYPGFSLTSVDDVIRQIRTDLIKYKLLEAHYCEWIKIIEIVPLASDLFYKAEKCTKESEKFIILIKIAFLLPFIFLFV